MIPGSQLPLNIKLRDEATFANYVGEAGRRLREAGNFVYVWGQSGSGRSHLLEAACHEARRDDSSCVYLAGLSQHDPEILAGLEAMSLVCVDDLHTIVGRRDWEVALFHLVNGMKDSGNRLIVSADAAASRLPVELDDLRSRLLSAVSVETDRLSDEQKLEAIQLRAGNRGFNVSDEVGRFILGRTDRSMSNLVDLLQRLDEASLREKKRVTIPFVKQTLRL